MAPGPGGRAGAKQPKGDLDGSILPGRYRGRCRTAGRCRIHGRRHRDHRAWLPDKTQRKEPELLEILGSGKEEPLVTTQLAPKGRGRGKGDRKQRDGRGRGRGDRGDRRGTEVTAHVARVRTRSPNDPRPSASDHAGPTVTQRSAEVPDAERPIAEQVLKGGVPAVRDAVRKQNEAAKAENRPEMPVDQVVDMAEKLLPKLRSAEWLGPCRGGQGRPRGARPAGPPLGGRCRRRCGQGRRGPRAARRVDRRAHSDVSKKSTDSGSPTWKPT